MLKRMIQRFRDMTALSALMQSAERHSQTRGEGRKPAAEHFVLAAIESPDGAAKDVFLKLGLRPADFADALREQYKNTLTAIGIDVSDAAFRVSGDAPNSKGTELPQVTESGSQLLRSMSEQNKGQAFSSADVLRAIDSVPSGPVHRAFRIMGTTAEKVAEAAAKD